MPHGTRCTQKQATERLRAASLSVKSKMSVNQAGEDDVMKVEGRLEKTGSKSSHASILSSWHALVAKSDDDPPASETSLRLR